MSKPGPRKPKRKASPSPKRGRDLELLVARLEGFLQSPDLHGLDLEVVSPARWRDEQTQELREVDVSIGPKGALPSECVMIECRDHRTPQNSMWLEQIEGKRKSLRPKRVIVVSKSGFWAPAKVKAEAWGIELRSLQELTSDTVGGWLLPGRPFDVLDLNFVVSDPQFFLHGASSDLVQLGAPSDMEPVVTLSNDHYRILGGDGTPVALADLPLYALPREILLGWYAEIAPGGAAIERKVEQAPGPGQLWLQAGGRVLSIALLRYTLTLRKVVCEATFVSATAYHGQNAELSQTATFQHAEGPVPTTVVLTRATESERDGTHRLQIMLQRPVGWRDESLRPHSSGPEK